MEIGVSERASDNVTPEQNAPTPATDAVAPDTDTGAPDEGGGCSEPATVLDPDGGRLLPEPLVRSASAEVPSRYAGAMLLHPFLSRLGVDDVLRGIGDATARRYDAASVSSIGRCTVPVMMTGAVDQHRPMEKPGCQGRRCRCTNARRSLSR